MWVACQALKQAIRTGQLGAASWQQQLKPLRDEAVAIQQVAGTTGRPSAGRGGTGVRGLRDEAVAIQQVAGTTERSPAGRGRDGRQEGELSW